MLKRVRNKDKDAEVIVDAFRTYQQVAQEMFQSAKSINTRREGTAAALDIQRMFRGAQVRNELRTAVKAATKIQSLVRAYKPKMEFEAKKAAASTLQTAFRKHLAPKVAARKVREATEERKKEVKKYTF